MTLMKVYVGDHEITLKNNAWGKEMVLYNGAEMSAIQSWGGARHQFMVVENSEQVIYQVKFGFGDGMTSFVGINIWRNEKPVLIMLKSTKYKELPLEEPPADLNMPDESEFV